MPSPLVSCIMPTANRRRFVPLAIKYFLRQDYPEKELVILDDGEDSVADLIPEDSRIRYFHETKRRNVGAKRNALCELAQGQFIAHWDDDDWYATNRLSLQVDAIRQDNADMCGLDRVFFLMDDASAAWEYVYASGAKWICGTTLFYAKNFWKTNRFPEIAVGEDSRFVWADRKARIVVMKENRFSVAMVHRENTSPKRVRDPAWEVRSPELVSKIIGGDYGYYTSSALEFSDSTDSLSKNEVVASTEKSNFKASIGIHITDDGKRLMATWKAIEASTDGQLEIILLADGVDESAEAMLSKMAQFRRIGFTKRHGAPACFNLLVREGKGDILIFIESGALPGPGWLKAICLALYQNPVNGLAGPSTNRSWNMQCVFPHAKSFDIYSTALVAQRQFAYSVRSMEPLYCLADFCYAVKREVVEAIGEADESYGEGPCWEMDYSVRAVRAGWHPVWAQSAYVYRMPLTPERERSEKINIETSRFRYQNKFCARQLNGKSGAYNTHCRGELCINFAPKDQITIFIPFNKQMPESQAPILNSPEENSIQLTRPLVSCIMPTRNRRPFIDLALRCFDAQDYEPRELIIIDDGDDPIGDLVKGHPCVHYRHINRRLSIGTKRNLACQESHGAIVMHWDDDDWYSPNRISAQVDPILSGDAQITGIPTHWILTLDTREFWSLSPTLHKRMFEGNITGGTLTYKRSIWEDGNRFPNVNLAEDAAFLRQTQKHGLRLVRIVNDNLFIYMRHRSNTWNFEAGSFLDKQEWLHVEPPLGFDSSLIDRYQQAMISCLS